MKNISVKIFLTGLLAIASLSIVKAQVAKDEIAVVQGIWGMEKRAIVNEFMKFTDAESAAFTPVYDAYVAAQQKLGAERIQIISEYANNYVGLTNEKADDLVKRMMANNKQLDQLQITYYPKFKKAITPLRAAQFFQLDSYLSTMVKAEIQNNLPMIGELDKRAK